MLKKVLELVEREQKSRKGCKRLHASDLGKCPRAVYFNYSGIEPELDEQEKERFLKLVWLGELIHREVLDKLERAGVLKEKEKKLEGDLLEGSCDGVIVEDGREKILEIKTVGLFKFSQISEPLARHKLQLNAYLGLGKMEEGKFLYINRDNGDWKEFEWGFDNDLYKKALEEAEYILNCLEWKIVPKEMDLSQCDECWYFFTCRNRDRGKVVKL